jgi:DNA-binding NarL/FixJ family response regulator
MAQSDALLHEPLKWPPSAAVVKPLWSEAVKRINAIRKWGQVFADFPDNAVARIRLEGVQALKHLRETRSSAKKLQPHTQEILKLAKQGMKPRQIAKEMNDDAGEEVIDAKTVSAALYNAKRRESRKCDLR